MSNPVSARRAEPLDHEPLIDVLSRVRGELEDIARRIDDNQSAIARSTWQSGAGDDDYLRAMQDADLSAQRIAGLAGYLDAIARAAAPDWQIRTTQAAASLTLAEMAVTIGGAQTDVPTAPDTSGDVDLF